MGKQKMQKNTIGKCCLFLALIFGGCMHQCVHELKMYEDYYEGGQLRVRYTYYIDDAGKQVLHGRREEWLSGARFCTWKEYRDGKVIDSGIIITNDEELTGKMSPEGANSEQRRPIKNGGNQGEANGNSGKQ